MKKNILIIGLIFIIPIIAYMGLTQSGTTTAKEALAGRPQVLKFTSAIVTSTSWPTALMIGIFDS